MNAKLTQLLHFAKPSLNGRRVNAADAARQVATLFRADAERRGVRLELEAPAGDAAVHASEEAPNEILSNLVVNAIEAQPEGGRVRVGLANSGKHLDIFVEDDGPGISPMRGPRSFSRFSRRKPRAPASAWPSSPGASRKWVGRLRAKVRSRTGGERAFI